MIIPLNSLSYPGLRSGFPTRYLFDRDLKIKAFAVVIMMKATQKCLNSMVIAVVLDGGVVKLRYFSKPAFFASTKAKQSHLK